MYIGIKDGKIWDICSDLRNKRDDSILDKDYLDLPMGDFNINDTWDFDKKESLKDSPYRFEKLPKTKLELLEERIIEVEKKLGVKKIAD